MTHSITKNKITRVLNDADLNWDVKTYKELSPFDNSEIGTYGTYRNDNMHIFKTGLTDKYHTIQNREAFETLIELSKVTDIKVNHAGHWNEGREVFAQLNFNGGMEIGNKGDIVDQRVTFHMRHDGKGSLRFAITPMRLWCQNQLSGIFSSAKLDQVLRIRHTASAQERLKLLSQQVLIINGVFKRTSEIFNTMQDTKIKTEHVVEAFEALFPTNGKSKSINTMNQRTHEVIAAIFQDADKGRTPVNTAWNLYNSLTNYNTHQNDALKNPERSLTVGTGVATNNKAIEAVAQVCDLDYKMFDVDSLLKSIQADTTNTSDIDAMLSAAQKA